MKIIFQLKNSFRFAIAIIFLAASFYFYFNIKEVSNEQNTMNFYQNLISKQQNLIFESVLLTQNIARDLLIKGVSQNSEMELKEKLNDINVAHETLMLMVLNRGYDRHSSLDDVYFGTGNLSGKMEEFLQVLGNVLFSQNINEVLSATMELKTLIVGEDSIIYSLDLAALSLQIHLRNISSEIKNLAYYWIFCLIVFVILESTLALLGEREKAQRSAS